LLRSLHAGQIATPVTRHARCRAAGCLSWSSRLGSRAGRSPSAALVSRGPQGRRLSGVERAPSRSRCARGPVTASAGAAGPRCFLPPSSPVQPTALPPAAPPSLARGTCGGGSSSGGPGNRLIASAA